MGITTTKKDGWYKRKTGNQKNGVHEDDENRGWCVRGRRRKEEAKGMEGGTYLDCKGRESQGNNACKLEEEGNGRAGEAPGYRYKPEEACKEVSLSQVGAGDLTRKLLNYWCQASRCLSLLLGRHLGGRSAMTGVR